ncbi:Poly [ADP-ribose] polymerase 6 [Liparis tanakae]|uniref:Poly [ADP-ribose] polymerase 6 n=1 Tax=Liparis tanakae TaxID=230148 RepID=A0A4Z2FAM9_9TELE|nr:Poly [ADP-ribose] polymerase 6 [Liparis tanakae]
MAWSPSSPRLPVIPTCGIFPRRRRSVLCVPVRALLLGPSSLSELVFITLWLCGVELPVDAAALFLNDLHEKVGALFNDVSAQAARHHERNEFHGSGMGKGQHRMPTKDELVQRYNRMNTIPQSRPIQSRFLQSRNLNCIALCEVITSKDLQKHGNIWVCPVSDHEEEKEAHGGRTVNVLGRADCKAEIRRLQELSSTLFLKSKGLVWNVTVAEYPLLAQPMVTLPPSSTHGTVQDTWEEEEEGVKKRDGRRKKHLWMFIGPSK